MLESLKQAISYYREVNNIKLYFTFCQVYLTQEKWIPKLGEREYF